MSHNSLTPAKYAHRIKATPANPDAAPEADSPQDVNTRAVNLDGDGVAYIDHVEGRVELTVKMRGRLHTSLILSPDEAGQLGMALARPDGPVLDDFFAVADAMRADPAVLAKQWGTAPAEDACACPDDRCAGCHHDADLEHCPCADSLAMDDAR